MTGLLLGCEVSHGLAQEIADKATRGAQPVPGVSDVLAARAAGGDEVVYVTNNSMHYRTDYLRRLTDLGAPVSQERVVSSARATAIYIAENEPGVRRVLVIGAGGLERELRDVGLEVVNGAQAASRMGQEGIDGWEAAGRPDAVVVGLDPQVTYLRIAAAADAIRAGARVIATNRDAVLPTERGVRGAGSLVAGVGLPEGAVGPSGPLDRRGQIARNLLRRVRAPRLSPSPPGRKFCLILTVLRPPAWVAPRRGPAARRRRVSRSRAVRAEEAGGAAATEGPAPVHSAFHCASSTDRMMYRSSGLKFSSPNDLKRCS